MSDDRPDNARWQRMLNSEPPTGERLQRLLWKFSGGLMWEQAPDRPVMTTGYQPAGIIDRLDSRLENIDVGYAVEYSADGKQAAINLTIPEAQRLCLLAQPANDIESP